MAKNERGQLGTWERERRTHTRLYDRGPVITRAPYAVRMSLDWTLCYPSGEKNVFNCTIVEPESTEGQLKWMCDQEFPDMRGVRPSEPREVIASLEAEPKGTEILPCRSEVPFRWRPQPNRIVNNRATVFQRLLHLR